MLECGTLKGQCSLDNSGELFIPLSPGQRRKTAVGTDRIMPLLQGARGESDLLVATWALQKDG